MHKFTNHLINESSPYLLQHAHNPVDWHAWNTETLEKAKKEEKMMLVSIGYSACHWCHVMERESFENEEIARMMNENFICVKVDREERPDVDAIYMNAVQLIHGHVGWPLNCFSLPDGKPFYGGTYFPPQKWLGLLQNIVKLFAVQRQDIERQAGQITNGISEDTFLKTGQNELSFDKKTPDEAYQNLNKNFDHTNGGFMGAPKFPVPNNFIFLLRYAHQSKSSDLKNHISLTLDKMAAGGIYDQVGGGFSRYSVDDAWHIPHFEKMLYDNAQLISLYTEAYLLFKEDKYLEIAEETARFVLNELTSPEGLFYPALDADSEGVEGKFYVWTSKDFDEALADKSKLIGSYFGVGKEASWEQEKNVLVKTKPVEDFARQNQLGLAEFKKILEESKSILLEKRNKRIKPGLDDKSLTSWNALMIKSLVDLYNATANEKYLTHAVAATDFILQNIISKNGGLLHSYKNGEATINGFLEDYAFIIEALTELYQATFNEKWLQKADDFMIYVFNNFFDDGDGFFWFTDKQSHDLIARKKEIRDSVMPSSNSSIAISLFKLSVMLDKPQYKDVANKMLSSMLGNIKDYPSSFSNWANLLLLATDNFLEVVIAGPKAQTLRKELAKNYYPSKIVMGSTTESDLPLFKDRFLAGKDLIYICTDKECKKPVDNIGEAIAKIKEFGADIIY